MPTYLLLRAQRVHLQSRQNAKGAFCSPALHRARKYPDQSGSEIHETEFDNWQGGRRSRLKVRQRQLTLRRSFQAYRRLCGRNCKRESQGALAKLPLTLPQPPGQVLPLSKPLGQVLCIWNLRSYGLFDCGVRKSSRGSSLTKKAEPRRICDVDRDSGAAMTNRRWLEREAV